MRGLFGRLHEPHQSDAVGGNDDVANFGTSPNRDDIEFLRGLTNLTRIGFKYDPAVHGPDKTAAEFWADYDKNRNENKAASSP